jgi:hypothetical protein
MSSLTGQRRLQIAVVGVGEELVAKPDVVGREGENAMHCSATGNGRRGHEVVGTY